MSTNLNTDTISYTPIGVIHTPFIDPADAPVQAGSGVGQRGTIEVFEPYRGGLLDLGGFSHILLLYHFHRSKPAQMVVTPYLDTRAHGIFATRAPARPNAIGLTVVRLLGVSGTTLEVVDLDMLDGTPLLDIKPFVPAFDHRDAVRAGWFSGKLDELDQKKGDARFLAQGR